jgi:hypothetical protein
MQYIKATKKQCEAYNAEVTQVENYQGTTSQWANVKEIEGSFYIAKHPNYSTELEIVNELPVVNEEI